MSFTLTTKSQVTLPKSIRDHLGVSPGDAVEFRIVSDGTVRVLPASGHGHGGHAPDAAALAKYRKLKGIGGHAGGSTDALMSLLRGYDDDPTDPGFAAAHTHPPDVRSAPTTPRRRE